MGAVVISAWGVIQPPARAHHAFTAQYDAAKPATLNGVVVKVEWLNPHTYFYIDVEDVDSGSVTTTGNSPSGFEVGSGIQLFPPPMLIGYAASYSTPPFHQHLPKEIRDVLHPLLEYEHDQTNTDHG